MSISILATVELQLIMHCCERKSLLALARCCRFTLAAASELFAWKHANPPVSELGDDHPLASIVSSVSSSLVRFGSIEVDFRLSRQHVDSLVVEDFNRLCSLPIQVLFIAGEDALRAQHFRWIAAGMQLSGTAILLHKIRVYSHSLAAEGAASVAELLPLCPCLTAIDVQGCSISDAGAETLCQAISAHPTISDVDLSFNQMGGQGLLSLLPAIQQRLVRLSLWKCGLTDADFTPLLSTLMQSRRMKSCICFYNPEVHRAPHKSALAELSKLRPDLSMLL
jgi:hypothetical protein